MTIETLVKWSSRIYQSSLPPLAALVAVVLLLGCYGPPPPAAASVPAVALSPSAEAARTYRLAQATALAQLAAQARRGDVTRANLRETLAVKMAGPDKDLLDTLQDAPNLGSSLEQISQALAPAATTR